MEAVLHGDEGIFKGIRPGSLVIDMGTTAVTKTRAFAAQVEALGGLMWMHLFQAAPWVPKKVV